MSDPAAQPGPPQPWTGWASRARAESQRLLGALAVPSQCEICRQWNPARLCPDCRARYALPWPRCARCGLRSGQAVAACGECLQAPPPFQLTCCALDYGFPWSQLLQAFKFRNQDDLARPLAGLLVDAVLAQDMPRPDLLLPVPSSAERLRERGYNQAWELARQVGQALKLPARADVLLRLQQGRTQSDLSREERQRNLRGAFVVAPSAAAALAGRHLALVDDVMTTGATAREAANTLLQAGVARVDVWVLARTPAPAA